VTPPRRRHSQGDPNPPDPLETLRNICLGLPGVTERMSHGEPAWFAGGKKLFVMYADHHHDDRLGFWCACEAAERDALVAADPGRYFVPPYVGHRGWLGAWLDVAVDWEELAEIVTEAFRLVAPRRLVADLEGPFSTNGNV
jgi:hypothetical protein